MVIVLAYMQNNTCNHLPQFS